jgi:hypothetical protein
MNFAARLVEVEQLFSHGQLVLSHIHNQLSVLSMCSILCLGCWSLLGLGHDRGYPCVFFSQPLPIPVNTVLLWVWVPVYYRYLWVVLYYYGYLWVVQYYYGYLQVVQYYYGYLRVVQYYYGYSIINLNILFILYIIYFVI